MMDQFQAGSTGKVIFLAEYRGRNVFNLPRPAPRVAVADFGAGETVFFITGGRFEAMVNGSSGIVVAGDFLRVPAGAAHMLRDIGELPGSYVRHRFAVEAPSQCLRELAQAMPLFATRLPPVGSPAYRRLKAIARRFRVVFDIEAA